MFRQWFRAQKAEMASGLFVPECSRESYQFRRTIQSPIGAMQALTAISLTELKAKMPDQADNLDPASIRTLEQ
jgi:hypothetical protein